MIDINRCVVPNEECGVLGVLRAKASWTGQTEHRPQERGSDEKQAALVFEAE